MSVRDPNPLDTLHPKRIAMVLSNPAASTTTGRPVGFWWSELTHPWIAFTERGYEVAIFSPAAGGCVADALSDPRDSSGYSDTDLISLGLLSTPKLVALLESTRHVAGLSVDAFDAIIVAAGQAPMFTFADAIELQRRFVAFFEAGKVAAALCHGVALMRHARLSTGELLVRGRTITGFASIEDDFADNVGNGRSSARSASDALADRG
jgi:putative intracellular protease/amidase